MPARTTSGTGSVSIMWAGTRGADTAWTPCDEGRRRAVCGRTARTVRRGAAGNGAIPMATDLAPARKDGNHGDRAYRINDRHRASGLPYNSIWP